METSNVIRNANKPIKAKRVKQLKQKKSLWDSIVTKSLVVGSTIALVFGAVGGVSFSVVNHYLSQNSGTNDSASDDSSKGQEKGNNDDGSGDNNSSGNSDNGNDNTGSDDTSSTDNVTGLSYNNSSSATYWISQRTMSLLFSYEYTENGRTYSAATAGTGWIYKADESTNTYYVATNLHVANILSFAGQSVTTFGDSSYETITYGSTISAYFGLAMGLTESSNSYSNTIVYYPISTPEVVYTTTSDSTYNKLFNMSDSSSSSSSSSTSSKLYYGYGANNTATQFYGAVDIAVLKLTINPSSYTTSSNIGTNISMSSSSSSLSSSEKSEYISTLKTWITNYFLSPTKIYTDYVNNLSNLDTTKIYMGGYPSYNINTGTTGSSISDITWLAFSDFTISTGITTTSGTTLYSFDKLNYAGNDYLSSSQSNGYDTPIAYYSSSSSSTSSESLSNSISTNSLSIGSFDNDSDGNVSFTIERNDLTLDTNTEYSAAPGWNSGTNTNSTIDSNYTNYNYMSIGVSSYLEATSFSGSSGSPIVIQDSNGDYMVAGIYWGGLSTTSGRTTYKKGIMTWFSTNSYTLGSNTISYNLTDYIGDAIKSYSN